MSEHKKLSVEAVEALKYELRKLDEQQIEADGVKLRPSECYRFELSPLHVLFNTNCPDDLKQKVHAIIQKHFPEKG